MGPRVGGGSSSSSSRSSASVVRQAACRPSTHRSSPLLPWKESGRRRHSAAPPLPPAGIAARGRQQAGCQLMLWQGCGRHAVQAMHFCGLQESQQKAGQQHSSKVCISSCCGGASGQADGNAVPAQHAFQRHCALAAIPTAASAALPAPAPACPAPACPAPTYLACDELLHIHGRAGFCPAKALCIVEVLCKFRSVDQELLRDAAADDAGAARAAHTVGRHEAKGQLDDRHLAVSWGLKGWRS